ncbi:MAG: TSCPD domain-containing protein [Bacteroidaceae bacterium]|nr:TSCPD domain-containing protein [Bacteroidaceae bacterium]
MQIDVEAENGILRNACFYGGCNENLRGIAKLEK